MTRSARTTTIRAAQRSVMPRFDRDRLPGQSETRRARKIGTYAVKRRTVRGLGLAEGDPCVQAGAAAGGAVQRQCSAERLDPVSKPA